MKELTQVTSQDSVRWKILSISLSRHVVSVTAKSLLHNVVRLVYFDEAME